MPERNQIVYGNLRGTFLIKRAFPIGIQTGDGYPVLKETGIHLRFFLRFQRHDRDPAYTVFHRGHKRLIQRAVFIQGDQTDGVTVLRRGFGIASDDRHHKVGKTCNDGNDLAFAFDKRLHKLIADISQFLGGPLYLFHDFR